MFCIFVSFLCFSYHFCIFLSLLYIFFISNFLASLYFCISFFFISLLYPFVSFFYIFYNSFASLFISLNKKLFENIYTLTLYSSKSTTYLSSMIFEISDYLISRSGMIRLLSFQKLFVLFYYSYLEAFVSVLL